MSIESHEIRIREISRGLRGGSFGNDGGLDIRGADPP